MKALRRLKFSQKSLPWALLALCVAAFGLLIPWLGYYWDDWAKILVARLWGLQGYWAYYAEDRPLSAWTHILFTPILGYRPLAWQLFSLLLTWLSALGAWWSLSRLWPMARRRAAYTALLFAVYPVFTLRAAAITFHQQWLQYALFLFSLGAMIQSVRVPRRFGLWTGLALAAMLTQLTVTEYFAPLELLRLPVLWFLSGQEPAPAGKRPARTLRRWAPYLLALAAYITWRLFFVRLSGEDPYRADTLYNFFSAPLDTALNLARTMLQDGLYLLVSTWAQDLNVGPITKITSFNMAALVFSAGVALAAALYLQRLELPEEPAEGQSSGGIGQALALGLLAVLLGMTPAWITGRELIFDFHSNRYAMPAMLGAALFWVAVLEWFVTQKDRQAVLLALVLGLTVNMHLRTLNADRWIWKQQKEVFWQLYWRAPYIQPGTAILSEREPFSNQGLFSTSAALNQLYPQPKGRDTLAYWWYTLLPHYANHIPEPLEIGFSTQFRTLVFQGSTPHSLLLSYDLSQGSCLRVLSPDDADDPYLSALVRSMLPISHLGTIQATAPLSGYPPVEMFGPEPAHTWCYYFQKADLARQQGNWDVAAALGDEAQALGYSLQDSRSNTPQEWMPFIEAYAHSGSLAEARQLTLEVLEKDERHTRPFCTLWERVQSSSPDTQAETVIAELGCREAAAP